MPLVSPAPSILALRTLHAHAPFPAFEPGDAVRFFIGAGAVRASVLGIDIKARSDLPSGLPLRISVLEAPLHCGYVGGREYTIRASCLEFEGPVPVRALAPVPAAPPPKPVAPAAPMFLVAYMREGGNFPIQGVLLVQAESLQAASAAATESLTAELAADVRDQGELPEATVMLLNAAEVPPVGTTAAGVAVIAAVSW